MQTPQEFAQAFYAARGQSVQLLPFFYCTTFHADDAGGIVPPRTQTIPIDRDSDFVWCDIRAVVSFDSSGAGLTQLLTQVNTKLSFAIDESGRRVMEQSGKVDVPVCTLEDVAGWADRPFILFEPLIVSARTVILVTVSSVDHLTAVDVALHGMKAVPGPL